MNTKDKIRIALIEDNRFVRDGWKITFESVSDFKVVGSFQNCEDAFQSDCISRAKVVLMDIKLPGISGIEGAYWLSEKYPELLIVMCTLYEDDENIFNAILAGAVGFISKRAAPSDLVRSIINLIDGGSPMTPNVARRLLQLFPKNEDYKLNDESDISEFEFRLLHNIAIGKSYQTIADEFSKSGKDILIQIRKVYNKVHRKLILR